jgi:quercetin dioxygenase-like cupin family protein
MRITLEPGAIFPSEVDDASAGLVYVEAGAVTVRIEAPIAVLRAAALATVVAGGPQEGLPAPPAEAVAAGAEATLRAGDSFVFPSNVTSELRNDGDTPAVILAAVISPTQGVDAGTPNP